MAITRNERIYGKAIGFTIDGVDYWADCKSVGLEEKEGQSGDKTTFADRIEDTQDNSNEEWELQITAIFSTATASLWRKLFAQKGKTLPFVFSAHGNKTADSEHPHYVGKVKIDKRPPIKVEFDPDPKPQIFSITYKTVGGVTEVTSDSEMGSGNLEDSHE